jgi:hypothetical protein
MDTYIRGVDSIELLLTLTYEDTGLPIDTDDLDEIQVEIITSRKNIPSNIVKWTGTLTGGEVIVIEHSTGDIAVYLDPDVTATWPVCKVYYLRVTKTETDANYSDDVKITSAVVEAFKLIVE